MVDVVKGRVSLWEWMQTTVDVREGYLWWGVHPSSTYPSSFMANHPSLSTDDDAIEGDDDNNNIIIIVW